MGVTFVWNGDQVERQLRALLAPRVLRAAEAVADQARENAPVKTGKLRDSIHVEPTADPLVVKVVASDPAAPFVELGTEHQPQNMFLRHALVSTAPVVKQILRGG